ncbi:ribonuclease H-like domain-containing protein [Infundibulicybe gibba]|nr:ribonuclease H-like domain-containing protein [Infundibulicybe gibba]
MATDSGPNYLAWQQNGHSFKNLPPDAQAFVKTQLQPTEVQYSILFPDAQASVLDLISARIPPIHHLSSSFPIPDGHSFFTTLPPTAQLDPLYQTPVPPKGVVATLISRAKQQWLDGSQSITLPGNETYFPLWSAQFWREIQTKFYLHHTKWNSAIHWLQSDAELLSHATSNDVHDTLVSLSTLSWAGSVTFSSGLSCSKSALAPFLSREWLSDEQVDIMIATLDQELKLAMPGRNVILVDTILAQAILKAHFDDSNGTLIYCADGDSFLHRFGFQLTKSTKFGGVFHVRGNHWIAVAADLDESTLFYGDPAFNSPDVGVTTAIRWFINKHLTSIGKDKLNFKSMPITKQDFSRDSWNCAIYSINALATLFSPQTSCLIGTAPQEGDFARIAMLRRVIAQHNATVSLHMAFLLPSGCDSPPPVRREDEAWAPAIETLNLEDPNGDRTVSPDKPPTRKRKTGVVAPPALSVIAPIFKVKKISHTAKSGVENIKSKHARLKLLESGPSLESADSDREVVSAPTTAGRPRLDILDELTIEIPTGERAKVKKYRCAGTGCPKVWSPRSRARVLQHCKRCLKMTPEQRQRASKSSASSSPGALVAAVESRGILCPANTDSEPTSPSHTPVSPKPPRAEVFFGPVGRRQIHNSINLAVVKFMCVAGIAINVVNLPEWKDLFQIQTPSYQPASATHLMDDHIMSEQERVREIQIAYLKTQTHLTISFDGGSTRGGEAFYTVHATTPTHRVVLLEGRECTQESHTGSWIAEMVLDVIDTSIGREAVIAVSSDNTGNTRVAREILEATLPAILNLPDPNHHLNNTWKNIAELDYFELTVKRIRGTIKFFKHSTAAKAKLKEARTRLQLGPGLRSIGKTRFATLVHAAVSISRNLRAIRELVTTGAIVIPMLLNQFIAVGNPIAKAIQCLEATTCNPADVYLYWLAVVAYMKRSLETSLLPDDVCGEIRGIMVARWREFFISGPTNVYLTAFYLNPRHLQSAIFKNPNPLTFNITIPAQAPPKVPPGIGNPKTFIEVGAYAWTLLLAEIDHGSDDYLTSLRTKPAQFVMQEYQSQFTAYSQRAYPFTTPMGEDEDPRDWWGQFKETPNGGILAALAIKIFSAVPHSMADERTMSVNTMLNTALRNRQKVDSLVAMLQVRGYYRGISTEGKKLRKNARPHPVLKFFELKQFTGPDDDDDEEASESDDENDTNGENNIGGGTHTEPSDVLPLDHPEDEFDMSCPDLEEMLSDGPIARKQNTTSVRPMEMLAGPAIGSLGGNLELGEWV